jgi:hypothetical protein
MIANQKDLFEVVDFVLKPVGYTRKAETWYFHSAECIVFLSLGKSPFAGRYENLLGCFVKKIYKEETQFPKYYKKNLGYSIEEFIGQEKVRKVFDLENKSYQANEREKEIEEILRKYVIPFLNAVSRINGIIAAIKKYKNLRYYIDGDLSEYLKTIKQ